MRSAPGTHPPIERAAHGVDVVALTHNETSTGVAMDLRRPDGRCVGCRRRNIGRGRPALVAGRGRRLLLRAAEVLRQRWRTVAGGLFAGRDRADTSDQVVSALDAGVARSQHCPRQHLAQPDVQHTGLGDVGATRRAVASGCSRTVVSTGASSDARSRRRSCTTGRCRVRTPHRSSPIRHSVRRW